MDAVNADGTYGRWAYEMVRQTGEVNDTVMKAAQAIAVLHNAGE